MRGVHNLQWHATEWSQDEKPTVRVPLLTQPIQRATCDVSPAWASRIDPTRFGNPIAAEMAKAYARAGAAMDEKRWSDAEAQLEEELRLKREHERQGYMPWSLSDTLDNLDKVRAAQRP